MKISFITPTAYIASFGRQSDFILALSHLLDSDKENAYEKAITETQLPIILDNGVFENHYPEAIDSLVNKAMLVNAESIFAPDILYNQSRNEAIFEDTYSYLKEIGMEKELKLNVVIQADNYLDYIASYNKFAQDERVNLIGLSILTIPKCFHEITGTNNITVNRIKCLEYLNAQSIHKDSHLLGAGSSYKDVQYAYKNCPWVVSHDSSSAFWNGVHNKRILKNLKIEGGKTAIKVDFNYNIPLNIIQRTTIQHNINIIRSITCPK